MVNERTGIFQDWDDHPSVISPFGWGRSHLTKEMQKFWWCDGEQYQNWSEVRKVYSRELMVW